MKPQPTLKTAEKFAKSNLKKIKSQEDREFLIVHSKFVGELAVILAENKKVDKELLKIAGWLHDIGYSVQEKEHAKFSLEIAEKEFELRETLKDCILNHGTDGKPKTEEGKIIQIADKASIFNPELMKIFVRYSDKKMRPDFLDFIQNKMTAKSIEFLKGFELK